VTCIVGLVDTNGHVIIGGDSAGVGGLDISIRTDPKVFQNQNFLFGMCGSFRMGQLLHHSFVPPSHPKGMDDYKFMVTLVMDAVRECFKKGGYASAYMAQEIGGCFLMAYNSKLYRIDNDYQVGIPAEGYSAVGCGDQIAHGAMFATTGNGEDRVKTALLAAAHFSAGVRAPFILMNLPPGQIHYGKKSRKKKARKPSRKPKKRR
jgi:ATP-dependent protease HslVU (ClpYQ) peptidase subunit